MTDLQVFLWGFGGSAAIEVVNLYHIYQAKDVTIPERYKRKGFWFIRFLLAVMAGGLALAYKIDTPLLAVNIGAATPLILQALSQNITQSAKLPED